MKNITIVLLTLFSLPLICLAEPSTDEAIASAKAWLAKVDAEEYGESWDEAAAFFKEKVSKEVWVSMVSPVRDPLGKVESRELASATYTESLPGAPEGDYVVIQFATDFEEKEGSIETITPMRQSDGSWRVSGYFIK